MVEEGKVLYFLYLCFVIEGGEEVLFDLVFVDLKCKNISFVLNGGVFVGVFGDSVM